VKNFDAWEERNRLEPRKLLKYNEVKGEKEVETWSFSKRKKLNT
jgi:hypothetical protein